MIQRVRQMPFTVTRASGPCWRLARARGPCHGVVFLLLLLLPALARAEPKATVSGGLNVTALKPGADATIAVVLDVKEGFHAQSHTPLEDNLIPCEVTLQENPNLTASTPIYPPAKIETYSKL